jgi:hypothetical protein
LFFPERSEEEVVSTILKDLKAYRDSGADQEIKRQLYLCVKYIKQHTNGITEGPTFTFSYHSDEVKCDAEVVVNGERYVGKGEPHAHAKSAKSSAMFQLLR